MKRTIAFVLIAVLAFSLCACGATPEKELKDSVWEVSGVTTTDISYCTTWTFNDGRVRVASELGGMAFGEEVGSYTVEEDGIIALTWDNPDSGRVKQVFYSFENGTLHLFTGEDHETEMVRVK